MTWDPRSAVANPGAGAVRPSPALRSHVSAYWWANGGGEVQTLPDGCVDLTFDLVQATAFVTGVTTRPHRWTLPAAARLFGVRFVPGAALPLLGAPLGDLERDNWQPLDDIIGQAARALALRLAETARLEERLQLVDVFLLRRLADVPIDSRVLRAFDAIKRTAGTVAMGELGKSSGASPRNLARLFHEWVGLNPKRFARIVRFQSLLRRLERCANPDWSALALELGWFDQAHMINDFTELAGLTPSQYLAARG
jgi:AraC-like DNA-binding protein